MNILSLKFYARDLMKEVTINEYLKMLLLHLIEETECFNGKRPFGESDWAYDIIRCLVENKAIRGEIIRDEDGDVVDFEYDEDEYQTVMKQAICKIFQEQI